MMSLGDPCALIDRSISRASRRFAVVYFLVQFGLLTILEVLRVTAVFNTSLLVRPLSGFYIAVAAIVLVSHQRLYVHPAQIGFLAIMTIGPVVGVANGNPVSSAAFLSHIVQPLGAMLMIAIGWNLGPITREELRFLWRVSVIAGLVALVAVAAAFGAGLVPRYNGPSYTMLPALAIGLGLWRFRLVAVPFGVLFISAKRGAMAAGLIAVLIDLVVTSRARMVRLASAATIALVLSLVVYPVATSSSSTSTTTIARLVEQTTGRVQFSADAVGAGDLDSLDVASSGRLTEIDAALELWEPWTAVLGRGAGTIMGQTHNIHLSPLGMATVHGIPATVFVYGLVILAAVSGLRNREQDVVRVSVAIYCVAAIGYSLTAYNIFTDLLIFVATGWLLRQRREDARGSRIVGSY